MIIILALKRFRLLEDSDAEEKERQNETCRRLEHRKDARMELTNREAM
jgi:hypothetical protein